MTGTGRQRQDPAHPLPHQSRAAVMTQLTPFPISLEPQQSRFLKPSRDIWAMRDFCTHSKPRGQS